MGLAKCLDKGRFINIIEHTEQKNAEKKAKKKKKKATHKARDFWVEIGGMVMETTDKSGARK